MRFLSYLVTLLFASLLASCGGGGGSPGTTTSGGGTQAFFTTAPAQLTLALGEASEKFDVAGGKTPFTATSNNSAVAVASIDDKTLVLAAVSPGLATITLRDALGASTSVAVTVQPSRPVFSTAPASITVPAGTTQTFDVGGGFGKLTATSSNTGVASAVLSGTSLTITGLAVGTADVQILDSVGGTTVITVTVPTAAALFTTAPSAITLGFGSGNAQTFAIGGGAAGGFTVTSSNTNVAAVSRPNANSVTITGLVAGTANVQVRDTAGATVSIAVTVSAGQLTLNPTTVSAFIGDTVFSRINGASGAITAVSGFPDAAQVDVGTLDSTGAFSPNNTSGDVLRIRVKQTVASDVIVVRDANGGTANFTLTATAGTNQISLSPASLTISGGTSAASIPLTLFGASTNGPVNLFSSDPDVLSVTTPVAGSVAGTAVTVSKPAVCFVGDPAVTITAIDSVGAKAESTITLQTPAAGCP